MREVRVERDDEVCAGTVPSTNSLYPSRSIVVVCLLSSYQLLVAAVRYAIHLGVVSASCLHSIIYRPWNANVTGERGIMGNSLWVLVRALSAFCVSVTRRDQSRGSTCYNETSCQRKLTLTHSSLRSELRDSSDLVRMTTVELPTSS